MTKKILLCMLLILPMIVQAQESSEKISPSLDLEIVRRCSALLIEGKTYFKVEVTLKSMSPDHFISDKYRVKVTVRDINGKKIYKKNFKNSYLYIFNDGHITVGRPKFTQVIIGKDPDAGIWYGEITQKEGIEARI